MNHYKKNIYLFLFFDFLSNLLPLTFIYVLFLSEKGNSLAFIGLLISCYQASKLIFEVPSGYFADKYGRKLCGVIGQVLFIMFLIMTMVCKSKELLILSAIVRGIGYAGMSGTFDCIFSESILALEPERMSQWLSIDKIVFYFAYGMASILGGLLAQVSYSFVILTGIILQGLCLLITLLFYETSKKEERTEVSVGASFRYLKSNSLVVYLIIIPAVVAIIALPYEDFYSDLLVQNGVSTFISGIMLGSVTVMGAFAGLGYSALRSKFSNTFLIANLPMLFFLLFVLMAIFSRRVWFSFILYLAAQMMMSINNIGYNVAIQNVLDGHFRSTILSLRSLGIGLTGLIVSPIAGWGAEHFGYSKIFLILSLAALIIMLIFNGICKPARKLENIRT